MTEKSTNISACQNLPRTPNTPQIHLIQVTCKAKILLSHTTKQLAAILKTTTTTLCSE